MKYLLAVLLISSLVLAENTFMRSLRIEWLKAGSINSMSAAQTMTISGAKAAYRYSIGLVGNQKNVIPFGYSMVANTDARVANSIGFSYQGKPKVFNEFATATGWLFGALAGTCLGATEVIGRPMTDFLMETLSKAGQSGKLTTAQKQFGVFNMYMGNVLVTQPKISYSIVISRTGVVGQGGWLEYCNPKQ